MISAQVVPQGQPLLVGQLLHWGWGWLGIVWFLGLAAMLAWARDRLRRLPRLGATDRCPPAEDPGEWPLLSVLLAARNEAETVAAGMQSLLACNYPRLEVIAVDDRSHDATGAILDRFASMDRRLRVVHLTALPDGWLGKNHALQVAADAARGEWLLFTDADVGFSRSALTRAVGLALQGGFDHLAAAPVVTATGTGLSLLLAAFALVFTLSTRPWAAGDGRDPAVVGIGPFNLVRARAYRAAGGHRALPLAVLDDVVLGRVLKRAGCHQALAVASGIDTKDPRPHQPYLRFPWYPSLAAAMRGLEKNAFAAFDFRISRIATWVLLLSALILGPLAPAALAPGWQRLPWILDCCLTAAAFGSAGRGALDRFPWPLTPLYPVGWVLLAYTALRSAWVTLRQHGVRWRNTFYPLPRLRGRQLGDPPPPAAAPRPGAP